jgi:hypothetical protein
MRRLGAERALTFLRVFAKRRESEKVQRMAETEDADRTARGWSDPAAESKAAEI